MNPLTSYPIKTVTSCSYVENKLPIAQKQKDKQFTIITHVEKLSTAEQIVTICFAFFTTLLTLGITCAFKWQILLWQEGAHGKRFPRIKLLNKIIDAQTFTIAKTQANLSLTNAEKAVLSLETNPKAKNPTDIAIADKELARAREKINEMIALNPSSLEIPTLESRHQKLQDKFHDLLIDQNEKSFLALKIQAERNLNKAETAIPPLEKDTSMLTEDDLFDIKNDLAAAYKNIKDMKDLNATSSVIKPLENKHQNLLSRILVLTNILKNSQTRPGPNLNPSHAVPKTEAALVEYINRPNNFRIDLNKFYQPPKPLYTPQEATAALKFDFRKPIAQLWESVSRKNANDNANGLQIRTFANSNYGSTSGDGREKAILLSLITQKLQQKNNPELTRKCLVEIAYFYKKCAGGQVSTLKQLYRLIKGETTVPLYLLNALSSVKEALIENHIIIAEGRDVHKNALNYAIHHLGDRLGLDKSWVANDSNLTTYPVRNLQALQADLEKKLRTVLLPEPAASDHNPEHINHVTREFCIAKDGDEPGDLRPLFMEVLRDKFGWDVDEDEMDQYINLELNHLFTTGQKLTPFGVKLLLIGGDYIIKQPIN